MSAANLTPAKRGIDPENIPIQQPDKHPKLFTAVEEDEKPPPIETSQQLNELIVDDDHPPVPGSKVEQPKIAGGAKFEYDKIQRVGICKICYKRTTHTLFSCPEKKKFMIVVDGVKRLNFCNQCSTVGHMDDGCPFNEFELDFDDTSTNIYE